MDIDINWPAVTLATLLGLIVYLIWFSPYAFGGLWKRLEQFPADSDWPDLLPRLIAALVVYFAHALCLDGFFNFTKSNTFFMGVLAALQLSVGLAVPMLALSLIMGRRKIGLIAIYGGWMLLCQALAGGLLAAWQ
jgi:hypothetical protein